MSDDHIDDALERFAGDKNLAADLKANLERLRDGVGGPELAEMARDVLSGRTTLRDVARSSAYATPLTEAMDRFHEYDAQLTDEERAKLITRAELRLNSDQD